MVRFGIQQSVLHREPERRAVRKLRPEKLAPGIAVRVDVHHADRAIGGDRLENRERNRVIPARGDRDDFRLMQQPIIVGDLGSLCLEVVAVRQADIAEVGNAAQLVRVHAQAQIERAHQARRVADLTRSVPRTRAVGDAQIGRHADQSDVDIRQVFGKRRAHERGDLAVARLLHRLVIESVNDAFLAVAHGDLGFPTGSSTHISRDSGPAPHILDASEFMPLRSSSRTTATPLTDIEVNAVRHTARTAQIASPRPDQKRCRGLTPPLLQQFRFTEHCIEARVTVQFAKQRIDLEVFERALSLLIGTLEPFQCGAQRAAIGVSRGD